MYNPFKIKKMKKLVVFLLTVFVFAITFTSCSRDEDEILIPPPVISNTELGHDNSKIGYIGHDIHVEAEILAEGKVKQVEVEIHGHFAGAWKFNQIYTDRLAGFLNANFHRHIDIPADAAPGTYHFEFTVTDELGQTTVWEEHLEIKEDTAEINVENLTATPLNSGALVNIMAKITAIYKISEVEIEIHGNGYEKNFTFTDPEMVGQTVFNFNKELDIADAPAGHYHVHFTVKDQSEGGSKEKEFETHFDK